MIAFLAVEDSSFLTKKVSILAPKMVIPKNLKAVGPSATLENPIKVIKISGINMKPRPKSIAVIELKINMKAQAQLGVMQWKYI